MNNYVLYVASDGFQRTADEREKYADKMAKKIADKLNIKVVGIPVTNQSTMLERIDENWE